MFSIHAVQEKFENGVDTFFSLKTHQMFSVYALPEKFENGVATFSL